MNWLFRRLAGLALVGTTAIACDSGPAPLAPDSGEPASAAIQGVVLIGDSPIFGAQVSLTGPIATRTTMSGIDGAFAFGDLPPGVFTVRATLVEIACTSTTADVEAGETVTTSIDCASVQLQLTTTLTGTVAIGDTPLGGIQVTLTGLTFMGATTTRAVTTDAAGHFTFGQLPQGTYTLTAQAPGVACPTTAVNVQAREPATANIACTEELGGGTAPPPMVNAGKIAYERNGRIMVLDLDTNDLFQLVDGRAPSWSPDGERLVYQRPGCLDRSLPPYFDCDDVWMIGSDGSGHSPITSSQWVHDYDSVWSPDGSEVAFVRFVHGPDQTYLVVAKVDPPPPLWSERVLIDWWPLSRPTWSPDGNRIAFTCEGTPPRWESDICVVSSNQNIGYSGNGLRPGEKITDDTWTDSDPAWSPDGTRIAFTTDREDPGRSYVAIIRRDGSGFELLALGSHPAWSPDGSRIVFVGGAETPPGLYIVNTTGSDLTRITDNPADAAPSWGR